MAEYIERESLLAKYDEVHIGSPGGARKLIEEAPSVDVVPSAEGEWLVSTCKKLKCALDREIEEKGKIGIMYDEKCKENQELKNRIEFLLGAIDAYKFCILTNQKRKGGAE